MLHKKWIKGKSASERVILLLPQPALDGRRRVRREGTGCAPALA
jgi:hypothetical protein